MSKSKLTGIAPEQITETFGSDAFRYYFLRAIAFGQDGSFSWEDLAARYQAELANGFGNLASRVVAMVTRYCDGVVPSAAERLGRRPRDRCGRAAGDGCRVVGHRPRRDPGVDRRRRGSSSTR